MRAFVLVCALAVLTVSSAFAQSCPSLSDNGPSVESEPVALEGRLMFHDNIRGWFELKLDRPQCEQSAIELVHAKPIGAPMEIYRGCRVRSRGIIDFSTTGYYSLEMYQDVRSIQPIGPCTLKSRFPDYSKAKPDPSIRAYRVEMHLNFEPGDHPIQFHVTHAGKELRPCQEISGVSLPGP